MSKSAKRALVAGASTGIGEAAVRRLYKLSQSAVAVARREECLAALAAKTGCEYVVTDLNDEMAVGALAARVLEGGPVGVLVNNAGSALGMDTTAHTDPGRWITTYRRNVITALRTTRTFLSGMHERDGDLVSLTLTAAYGTYPGDGGYIVAKHAERIIANTLCQELIGGPVRIIETVPGMMKTSEFSLSCLGPEEVATKVYGGIVEPLLADDTADATC